MDYAPASLRAFNELVALPTTLCLSQLDDGSRIETTLSKHCAKWHKSCRDTYNSTKLSRLRKHKLGSAASASDSEVLQASVPRPAETFAPLTSQATSHFTRSLINDNFIRCH